MSAREIFMKHRRRIFPVVVVVAVLVVFAVFRQGIVAWFTGAPMGGSVQRTKYNLWCAACRETMLAMFAHI